ncbi:MAG: hypothetical protein JST19_04095 [Bacteroidetes bacterium]|nr:hypothetical protein [Bacteroidota bacterium]
MTENDLSAFKALFGEAYLKCFGRTMDSVMSETESRLFCSKVLDQTGLSIGWKSVKNYSLFVMGSQSARSENPSVATLDTLARYVLGAPYTTELKRKAEEDHFPWWFMYLEEFGQAPAETVNRVKVAILMISTLAMLTVFGLCLYHYSNYMPPVFSDNFHNLAPASLETEGWFVQAPDTTYWNKRSSSPGQLTLYTLKGDNWPDSLNRQGIKNLLLRKIPFDCFTAEVHLSDFIPREEWQQAGILLLEDTTLTGKSIRMSIGYNDFFGGYNKPREILVQAITSLGKGFNKPEEIAHKTITYADSLKKYPEQAKMLKRSALRIEKHGSRFRFLYSGGLTDNSAFNEVVSQDFDMQPRYIGIFAIKGFKDSASVVPVHFTFFRIAGESCIN